MHCSFSRKGGSPGQASLRLAMELLSHYRHAEDFVYVEFSCIPRPTSAPCRYSSKRLKVKAWILPNPLFYSVIIKRKCVHSIENILGLLRDRYWECDDHQYFTLLVSSKLMIERVHWLNCGDSFTDVHMLKFLSSFTINMCDSVFVNFTSIKLFLKLPPSTITNKKLSYPRNIRSFKSFLGEKNEPVLRNL